MGVPTDAFVEAFMAVFPELLFYTMSIFFGLPCADRPVLSNLPHELSVTWRSIVSSPAKPGAQSEPRTPTITSLPPELLYCVVDFLPNADACRLSESCRALCPASGMALISYARGIDLESIKIAKVVRGLGLETKTRMAMVRGLLADGARTEAEAVLSEAEVWVDEMEKDVHQRKQANDRKADVLRSELRLALWRIEGTSGGHRFSARSRVRSSTQGLKAHLKLDDLFRRPFLKLLSTEAFEWRILWRPTSNRPAKAPMSP